jgi:riboflavin kinase / FMN adenylyltransferase
MRSIAIGNFDGVHLGHQALIESARQGMKQHDHSLAVVTFDPHPKEALRPGHFVPRLCSIEDRIALLKEHGVDEVFVIAFNLDFAKTTAREFFEDYLIAKWNAQHVSVGPSFFFGNDRMGTPELLCTWMQDLGRSAKIIHPREELGEMISSSRIRTLLATGDVQTAHKLLGRAHYIKGIVSSGFKRGRSIGFATANLYPLTSPPPHISLPLEGVYVTATRLPDGRRIDSITNVGFRPTVHDHSPLSVETHLLNFDEDLYGLSIAVEFLDRIRPEMKFASIDALKSQITKDIEECVKYHKKLKK